MPFCVKTIGQRLADIGLVIHDENAEAGGLIIVHGVLCGYITFRNPVTVGIKMRIFCLTLMLLPVFQD
jgi:hypothetical protein